MPLPAFNSGDGAAAEFSVDEVRATSSSYQMNIAFDVLLERHHDTARLLSDREEQLDETAAELDASKCRVAELERRVAELEAAAASANFAARVARARASFAAAQPAESSSKVSGIDHERLAQADQLTIVPGQNEGAIAMFGHIRCRLLDRWTERSGMKMRLAEPVCIPAVTSQGSKLLSYYVELYTFHVYARVEKTNGVVCSCRVEFWDGDLCCGVPIWSSKGGDTPASIRWETIAKTQWVASPQSASAAAPSEAKKRSAPDAAPAHAVSKFKKRAKIATILGPYVTAQEARVILQPHGGRGGLYKIASEPNSRGNVFVNTETGVWIVIDWDLTIRATSSHFLENEHATPDDAVRKQIFRENGYSDADYDDYMLKMHSILLVLAKLREEAYCDIVIVTRNDYRNVEAGINTCATQAQSRLGLSRPSFSDENFPIIAFPENGVPDDKKKDKAQLLAEHVPCIKSATSVVFVDDSHGKPTSEHERFAASARDVLSPKAMWRHVRVRRCPRYAVATKRGKNPTPYGGQGLGNQVDKLNEIADAVMGSIHKDWTWNEMAKDQLGLHELVGHEGVFRE